MAIGLASREGKATRRMVWIAAAVALLGDIVYVLLILGQGTPPPDFTVPFVVAYIGAMAAILALSLSDQPLLVRWRPAMRAAGSAGLLVLGALALMSIGLALLGAGALATGAALRTLAAANTARNKVFEVVAAAAAVVVLVVGLEVSARIISCPPNGSAGGTGGLVTKFSWSCINGHIEISP